MRVTSRGEAKEKAGLGGSGFIAVIAFLVPVFIIGAVLVALVAWEGGQVAMRKAIEDARHIIERVDIDIQKEMRALAAVARRISGVPIAQRRPAPGNAAFNAELFPQWSGSIIWSLDRGETVFSSLPDEELPAPLPSWADKVRAANGPVADGIEIVAGLPSVLVHTPVPDDPRGLILTTAIRPEEFQEILLSRAPKDGVSALVDDDGNFIGRSLDFENRVGTPGTTYVRDAVKRGGEGSYRGRTWEGLENYTAYSTSALTGWSAHVAIANHLVDASTPWAVWVAIGGGLLSLLFAGGLVWLVKRDADRRNHAERSLANARRVETLGRLTGGIAHDFNNMLTVIIGGLERARRRSADIADSKEVGMALEAAQRAATLTRSLLLYSRPQAAQVDMIDLSACVRESAEIIQRTVGPTYQIEHHLDEKATSVRADIAQLASALLNLAVNARDAMPDGGSIILRTRLRNLVQEDRHTGLAAGDYVEVSVSDNGPGMPPEVARRAFDPFYTTKEIGKGTGLGLAQVDVFARQYGGVAELETAPGSGTRVSIILPTSGKSVETEAATSPAVIPKNLRVLLVEDEPAVREHALALLNELACEVVSCADHRGAVNALEAGEFDLLFSDIVLADGPSGVAIAEAVRSQLPGAAILLTTGYAGRELDGQAERWPVLHKPYGLPELTSAIASALALSRANRQA